VRRALLSVAVGVAGAAAVVAAGWSLQTAALPPPARGDRVAADAAAWLLRYRLLDDTFHVDGRTANGLCLHGWFPRMDGRLAPGSLLALRPGPRLLALGDRIRILSGHPLPGLPARLAFALGCTSELGKPLAEAAQTDTRLRAERSYAAARPAIALRLPRRHDERVTIYVSARSYRPVAAAATLAGLAGTARIRLTKVTPALMAELSAGPAGKPDRS
jgi:hypothetical protein